MYPSLRRDPRLATWIDDTTTTLEWFAKEHRTELDDCQRTGTFPATAYKELGRLGYLGPLVPEEHGGMGGGVAEYVVISEEVGRLGLVSGQVAAQGQRWLLDWGSPEQLGRWLRPIATGAAVFSESISEKNAGSSFKTMKSTAVRDGDGWILNGHKTHVNLGADADVTLFYAVAEEGLTSFLVDMTLPGVSSRRTDAVGLRLIQTADVDLVDVRVPDSALLGGPGQGLQTFLTTFNVSRLGNASELIGLGRRALDLGVTYAAQRRVGDHLVTDFQGIQWAFADSLTHLHAASLARDHAALVHRDGHDIALATSLAKRLAIDAAEHASRSSFSLVGGHGLYHDQPFVAIDNDIKVLKVAGGSSEVLRNYIARQNLPSHARTGRSTR